LLGFFVVFIIFFLFRGAKAPVKLLKDRLNRDRSFLEESRRLVFFSDCCNPWLCCCGTGFDSKIRNKVLLVKPWSRNSSSGHCSCVIAVLNGAIVKLIKPLHLPDRGDQYEALTKMMMRKVVLSRSCSFDQINRVVVNNAGPSKL
jgi:hypothetical protein